MKKIITLCVALFATVAIYAQQQLATLNHNGTITAYYGATAFQQAHAAATHGDVITLSSGIFDAVYISKAVTIHGNGMEEDTVAGVSPTIITGNFYMNISPSISGHLTIEGIKFIGIARFRDLISPLFMKCMFANLSSTPTGSDSDTVRNATFLNCVIEQLNINLGGRESSFVGTTFSNSIITNVNIGSNSITYNNSLLNCIAHIDNNTISRKANNVFPFFICSNH